MIISRCRIVRNSDGLFEIEEKGLVFGWNVIKEWGGCDPLGFDYGYFPITFDSIEEAEKYIERQVNKNVRTVVKELE